MATPIQRWLNALVAKFTALPTQARSVILASDGGSGLSFLPASPISRTFVAETDDEVADLQATSTVDEFLDARGPTLWTRSGDTWSSQTYTGNREYCRPHTLVYTATYHRFYYVAGNLAMTRVSLSSDPTPV